MQTAASMALVGVLDRIPTSPLALAAYLVVALFIYAFVSAFFDVPWYRKGYEGAAPPPRAPAEDRDSETTAEADEAERAPAARPKRAARR